MELIPKLLFLPCFGLFRLRNTLAPSYRGLHSLLVTSLDSARTELSLSAEPAGPVREIRRVRRASSHRGVENHAYRFRKSARYQAPTRAMGRR
jgi:hypothetical protein